MAMNHNNIFTTTKEAINSGINEKKFNYENPNDETTRTSNNNLNNNNNTNFSVDELVSPTSASSFIKSLMGFKNEDSSVMTKSGMYSNRNIVNESNKEKVRPTSMVNYENLNGQSAKANNEMK